ncbi:GATOR2 complex protein MIOS-A-like [Penaeus indicus]|uniref:GATOR2 complex protein MIOS-A-like n=1 Tax=Penaeus indicus TaxID=29960 RepID=UPI00300D39C0
MGELMSDVVNKPWVGLDLQKPPTCKVFRCEERSRALELCSWGFENEAVLTSFLAQLENAGNYTRAAAVAVFNQRIKQAIQILQKGAAVKEPTLNSTAMALSGFTEDRKALWRETCMMLRSQLTDPYLRAMFAFLTDDADSFDPVLGETDMAIQDRVAFACNYLSDARLMEYLERLKMRLTEAGNLDGILLTGLCPEGIDLLQRYVDLTGDVQTVALVTIHTLQHAVNKDSRLSHWVQSWKGMTTPLSRSGEMVQVCQMTPRTVMEGGSSLMDGSGTGSLTLPTSNSDKSCKPGNNACHDLLSNKPCNKHLCLLRDKILSSSRAVANHII